MGTLFLIVTLLVVVGIVLAVVGALVEMSPLGHHPDRVPRRARPPRRLQPAPRLIRRSEDPGAPEGGIKRRLPSADDSSMGSTFTIVISLVVAVPLLVMALLVEKLAQRS